MMVVAAAARRRRARAVGGGSSVVSADRIGSPGVPQRTHHTPHSKPRGADRPGGHPAPLYHSRQGSSPGGLFQPEVLVTFVNSPLLHNKPEVLARHSCKAFGAHLSIWRASFDLSFARGHVISAGVHAILIFSMAAHVYVNRHMRDPLGTHCVTTCLIANRNPHLSTDCASTTMPKVYYITQRGYAHT